MRHIIPISGKDSLATAIVQTRREPNQNYEYIFNDVGAELPETYEWLDRVEYKLGIKITRIGKSLTELIKFRGFLPAPRSRFCTSEAKIQPMVKYLNGDKDEPEDCFIYYGLRADEMHREGLRGKENLIPRYPLREEAIGLEGVYEIVIREGLKPPQFFWKDIYDSVLSRFKTDKIANLPEWEFDRLFAWRSRTNCYYCFYQRRYEWIGLYEHHPKLFAEAQKLEGIVDSREKPWYWVGQNYPLSLILAKKERFKGRRIADIVSYIQSREEPDQLDIFGKRAIFEADITRSCGLLCGK